MICQRSTLLRTLRRLRAIMSSHALFLAITRSASLLVNFGSSGCGNTRECICDRTTAEVNSRIWHKTNRKLVQGGQKNRTLVKIKITLTRWMATKMHCSWISVSSWRAMLELGVILSESNYTALSVQSYTDHRPANRLQHFSFELGVVSRWQNPQMLSPVPILLWSNGWLTRRVLKQGHRDFEYLHDKQIRVFFPNVSFVVHSQSLWVKHCVIETGK